MMYESIVGQRLQEQLWFQAEVRTYGHYQRLSSVQSIAKDNGIVLSDVS